MKPIYVKTKTSLVLEPDYLSTGEAAIKQAKHENGQPVICQDCGEELEPGQHRIRCRNCRMLLCGWCYNHCHMLALNSGDDGCALRAERLKRGCSSKSTRKRIASCPTDDMPYDRTSTSRQQSMKTALSRSFPHIRLTPVDDRFSR